MLEMKFLSNFGNLLAGEFARYHNIFPVMNFELFTLN